MTTVIQRPAHPTDREPFSAAQRTDAPITLCDEVLAARLAHGLMRVEWLGATMERLLRRVARRPVR